MFAFVTPDGLYQYKVMPFGMKNSPATSQRLINMIITGLDNCKAYIDGAIIYSEEWDQQIKTIREFFERLSKAKLTNDCQKAFDILKAILKNEPVLLAPNFATEFKLAVDASDTGAGSVLMQKDGNGVAHPVSYFSKKFNKHQKNYSIIEKECLSLILALQHFEVYLTSSPHLLLFSVSQSINFHP